MIPSGPEALILLVITVIGLGGTIAAIVAVVDIAQRPDDHFAGVSGTKTGWLIGVLVASLACGLGIIAGPYYLLGVRPKLPAR